MSTQLVQGEEAMRKSRQLLFTELCQYMGLKVEEVKKKWNKMDEDDKWVLVKGFVSEWGVNFHPLSARSVKAMIEEHLLEDNSSSNSSPSLLFSSLKKLMGFSPKKKRSDGWAGNCCYISTLDFHTSYLFGCPTSPPATTWHTVSAVSNRGCKNSICLKASSNQTEATRIFCRVCNCCNC
ncbi:hypothetical protein F0562_020852 [Nyssa sinensis]|uniref:DUF7026 domain-containing protein n=1 Tax=Nyssa sinensis TaxID=561372 RepID=A0A5J5BV98_9ASTE|nr:hypothetical protein F0562_020852 [Nyssa sinensis]